MGNEVFRLRPGKLTLGDLERLLDDRRRIEIDPSAWGRGGGLGGGGAPDRRGGPHRLWRQYRLRQPGQDPHPRRGGDRAPAPPRPLPCRGHRSAAGGSPGPGHHDRQDQRAHPRRLGRAARHRRGAGGPGQCRGLSLHPRQGLGGRLGRSGPARPYERRPHGRGRGAHRGTHPARPRWARPGRAEAAGSRGQGGAGAAQRHPGLRRAGGRRPLRRGPRSSPQRWSRAP